VEQKTAVLTFGPFRLLPTQRQLWKNEEHLDVRPMSLAMLTYMARHPERVVSIEELRQAVWGSTHVSRTTVRGCVRQVRQILGDEASVSRYIETVGRQGYCFIGSSGTELATDHDRSVSVRQQRLPIESVSLPEPFVGRQEELRQLRRWFGQAQQGQRQIVLVSGEPGIGKTTLVTQFMAQMPVTGNVRVGYGQCVESYGQGEAYLPILEALGRLGREVGAGKLAAVLHQHAPTWLAHLPALVDISAQGELHRQVAGATQESMLRELCDALEVLTAEQPLLLVLEDLHWSDTATLACLATIARRSDPARLLILGTYRPIEVVMHSHPLRGLMQELRTHRLCGEVRLNPLSADEVREYVHQQFARSAGADELGLRLYQRTDGNPLFLTASVEALLQQGVVRKEGDRFVVCGNLAVLEDTVPEDLQELITKQIEGLSAEEQQVLAVASVSGVSFTVAGIAAGGTQEPAAVEATCERLAQRGQVIEGGKLEEWPDGTLTARYSFRHALYQQMVYGRLGSLQKVRIHRLLGERKEAAYGERLGEIAGELAFHFMRGRDYQRAVRYQQLAAEQALRRGGQQEAMTHCEKGLELLTHLPATRERTRQELTLRLLLAAAQLAIPGVATNESGQNLERARLLCRELGETVDLIPVVIGLGRFYLMRAERAAVEDVAEQERHLLDHVTDPALALQLHIPLGTIALCRGALDRAQEHLDQALVLFDVEKHKWLFLSFAADPMALALVHSGMNAWLSGRPDQAGSHVERSLARAEEVSHLLTLAYTLITAAMVKLFLREPDEAERLAQRGISLARRHGFALYMAQGAVVQNCAALQRGEVEAGLGTMAENLAAYRGTGARLNLPFFLAFLAEGYLQLGRIQDGLRVVEEALQLTATNLDRFWEAELYRLKGELLLNAERMANGKEARPKQNDERKTKKK
jgi:DNA-binding winged helix-turn-helix (wHTH) protein/predicted ATPase